MGKSSKAKAKAQLALTGSGFPTVAVAPKAASTHETRPNGAPGLPRHGNLPGAAALGNKIGGTVEATAQAATTAAGRKEEICAYPSIGAVTGVTAPVNEINLMLVPLRRGAAAAAYFNEAAGGEKADECVRIVYDTIREIFDRTPEKVPVESVVMRGLGSLCAVRSSLWKNKRSGVFRFRIREEFAAWTVKALAEDFAVAKAFGGDATHEFIVPDNKWPAGVVEQIKLQFGLDAAAGRDWGYAASLAFRVEIQSEAHLARIEKAGGLALGDPAVVFPIRPIEEKITFEHFYVYGCTGVGSARLDLLPEVSLALGVSKDLVKVDVAQGVRSQVAVVMRVTYPFYARTYDNVCRLFEVGQFKLVNPRRPELKPLEITIAPTIIELQHVLGLPMVQAPLSVADESEEVEVEDLTPKLTEGCHD